MDVETLTINKNAGSCDVLFNETTPQNYPKEFRVYSNCDSGFVLYRNETVITNNSVQSLSAGSWNFTVQRNDSVNYTNIYDEEIFVISKATTSISVNGTSPINYGVTGDVEGTGCPAGVTCNLFREGLKFQIQMQLSSAQEFTTMSITPQEMKIIQVTQILLN